ncbi:hypothetical protein OF83DRAFT_1173209 [Amylostereum chailletii]|nr:hypothetical protein OF83DRAFT_1173209 [Amylostereum chailletii]
MSAPTNLGLSSENQYIQLFSVTILGFFCALSCVSWIATTDDGSFLLFSATVVAFLLRSYLVHVRVRITRVWRAFSPLATHRSPPGTNPSSSLPGPSAPAKLRTVTFKTPVKAPASIKPKPKLLVEKLYADYSQRPALSRILPLKSSLPEEDKKRTQIQDALPPVNRSALYSVPPSLTKLHAIPRLHRITRMPLAQLHKRDYSHIRPWVLPSPQALPKLKAVPTPKESVITQAPKPTQPTSSPISSLPRLGTGSQTPSEVPLPKLPGPPGSGFPWPKSKVRQTKSSPPPPPPPQVDDTIEIDDTDILMADIEPRSPAKLVFDTMQIEDGVVEEEEYIRIKPLLDVRKHALDATKRSERYQTLYIKRVIAPERRPCITFSEMQSEESRVKELADILEASSKQYMEDVSAKIYPGMLPLWLCGGRLPQSILPKQEPTPAPTSVPTSAPAVAGPLSVSSPTLTPAPAPAPAPSASTPPTPMPAPSSPHNPQPLPSNPPVTVQADSSSVPPPQSPMSTLPPASPSSQPPHSATAASPRKEDEAVPSNTPVSPTLPVSPVVATANARISDAKGTDPARSPDVVRPPAPPQLNSRQLWASIIGQVDQDVSSRAEPSDSALQAKRKGKAPMRMEEDQEMREQPQAQTSSSKATPPATFLSVPDTTEPSSQHFVRNVSGGSSLSTTSNLESHSTSATITTAVTSVDINPTLDSDSPAPSNITKPKIPKASCDSSPQSRLPPSVIPMPVIAGDFDLF